MPHLFQIETSPLAAVFVRGRSWGCGSFFWPYAAITLLSFCLFPWPSHAEIAFPGVFQEVKQYRQSLELLRRHMGLPVPPPLDIKVGSPAPHDVYFQALSLFRKTSRLAFEITRHVHNPPPPPKGVIRPADIQGLVIKAHEVLDFVLADLSDLGITHQHTPTVSDLDVPPLAVFQSLNSTNRQVNLLLEKRFSPSDAFVEVTRAVGYVSQQLTQYPQAPFLPDDPPFEADKRPGDVFFRLLDCLRVIDRIFRTAQLTSLEIGAAQLDPAPITPSDVFDLATVMVARLDYLHKRLAFKHPPRKVYYPGRKYPSHVYQRAGRLLALLHMLADVRSNPDPVPNPPSERVE